MYSLIQRHFLDEFDKIVSQSFVPLENGSDNNSNLESTERLEVAGINRLDRERLCKVQIGKNEVSMVGKEDKVGRVSRIKIGGSDKAEMDNDG